MDSTARISREQVDAVVVGAGLAGLYALYRLREGGLSVRVFEAGGGVGGTWYWNCYPGARCDVESVDYSFSFSEELQQEWTWSERYAAQPEIQAYIQHVSERFDLLPHITFETRVESAVFDAGRARWTVSTDRGETVTARICVMATGCLSTRRVPPFAGLEDFTGEQIHPGAWPQDRDVSLRGKKVGIIGTGSTGIQIVAALAQEVDELYVFQRTANYSMPAHNGPLPPGVMNEVKATYAQRRRDSRQTKRGFPVPAAATADSVFNYTPEEQRERLERMWSHGGAIFTSVFGDLTVDARANEIAADFVREKIRQRVNDPAIAERLSPRDHPLGGKRPCVDTDYYEAFNRDAVRLVDLKETPIVEFHSGGLRTSVETFDLDTVIFATGYDAITGSLNAIEIRGIGGRRLRDKWDNGPTAYLGLCSAGFPNLFMLTGPGSPSVLCNMVVSIEQHVELMLTLLDRADHERLPIVTAEPDAEMRWAEHVADIANGTLLVEANSWYLGANIPGKPRMFMPYAAGMATFIAECDAIVANDFEGFSFGASALERVTAKTV